MESIGVKIQVDGGKQFRAELAEIKATSKQLSAELKNVVNGLDSTGDAEKDAAKKAQLLQSAYENAGRKVEVLTSQLDKQESNLREMESALEAAKNEYGDTSPQVAKLSTAITKQNTEIAKTKTELANAKGEMASYANEVDELGRESDDTAESQEDLGDSAKEAGDKAGDSAKGGWTTFKGIIADLAASAVKELASALKELMKEAISAEDSLIKFSQTMSFAGIDPDVVDEAAAAMKEYADQTVYDLETISKTVAQLGANGVDNFEALVEAAGNLNAAAGGDANTFESVASVLTQTAGAGKLTTENWKQMMNQIPGAAGVLKQALLDMGAYEGNFEEALSKGKITAEEFNAAIMQVGNQPIAVEAATSVTTFEGAMGNLEATATSAMQAIIQQVGMENITGFLTTVANFIQDKVTPAIAVAADWIRANVIPVVQEIGGYISAIVVPVLQSLWSTIEANIIPVLQAVVGWIKEEVWPILQSVIQWIIANVVPLIQSLVNLIGKAFGESIRRWLEKARSMVNYLKTTFGPIIQFITNAIADIIGVVRNVADAFSKIKWEWPTIKLPHFKIEGKFSLNPLSVPHLAIDWFDKGGIFTRPSIIGVGEKRPEFVGALDDLRKIVREETGAQTNVNDISINVYASDNMDVYELAQLVSDKIQSAVNRRAAVYA